MCIRDRYQPLQEQPSALRVPFWRFRSSVFGAPSRSSSLRIVGIDKPSIFNELDQMCIRDRDKVALDMICQKFGVSKTAAVIRLRQLGHLETRRCV